MADYGPSLKAARLYEKTSIRGNSYLAGRWGALKVVVVKTKDVSETGEPIWQLLLSQAPKPDGRPARPVAEDAPESVKNDWQRPAAHGAGSREPIDPARRQISLDDTIPF